MSREKLHPRPERKSTIIVIQYNKILSLLTHLMFFKWILQTSVAHNTAEISPTEDKDPPSCTYNNTPF